MSSLKDYIANLKGDKRKFVQVLNNVGINASDSETFTELIPKVSGIAGDVLFLDYDGSIIYSYDKDTFLSLSSMPSFPTHTGLVPQAWTYTLEKAQAYVRKYGMLDVGLYYTTSDGSTRIYITLDSDQMLSPYLQFIAVGEVTIDWGDGTSNVVTGTTSIGGTTFREQHNYSAKGDYVIRIIPSEGAGFRFFTCGTSCKLLVDRGQSDDSMSADAGIYYLGCIKKIEVGSISEPNRMNGLRSFAGLTGLEYLTFPTNFEVGSNGNYVFDYCPNLKYLLYPKGTLACGSSKQPIMKYCTFDGTQLVTTNLQGMLNSCKNLKRATLPEIQTFTTLPGYSFYGCSALEVLVIPDNITAINQMAVTECLSLKKLYLSKNVITIADYNFNKTSLEEIVVPASVTTINGTSTFSGNRLLKKITYNCVGSQDIYVYLSGCTRLEKLTMPDNIKYFSLNGCSNLSEIKIPASVTSIETAALSNCTHIIKYDFTSHTTVPAIAYAQRFNNISTLAKILVPEDLYSTWITTTNWSSLASYIYPVDSEGNILPKP